MDLAFEPGLKIDGETVCRTFQPSYVVTENGTLIVFCQGRLKGGRDNEPKVVLMNRSDDRGETWSMDGMTNDYLGNEASAVSINQGEKILMIRRFIRPRCLEFTDSELRPGPNERIANISEDGGKTWSDPFLLNMSGIRCHGTLARIDDRLYFSIPTGQELEEETDRSHGAIYFSDDEGQSWSRRIVEEGPYSYSTVGRLTDSKRITFFARGGLGDQGIGYRIFTDEWLENGDSQ